MTGRRKVGNKKHVKTIQCPYCINVLQGEVFYSKHILARHPEHIDDYISGKDRNR